MEEEWRKLCASVRHDCQPPLGQTPATALQGTECSKRGTCLCGHQDTLRFHKKLVGHFKQCFFKEGKNMPSPARRQFEAGLLVFGLAPGLAGNTSPQNCSLYFHPGHVDFRTWNFACLQLERHNWEAGPCILTLRAGRGEHVEDGYLEATTCFDLWLHEVDVSQPWNVQFLSILSDRAPCHPAEWCARYIDVRAHLTPFQFWRGAHAERPRPQRRKRPAPTAVG